MVCVDATTRVAVHTLAYPYLIETFSPSDLEYFLTILLPLPTLPVEFSGELSMLHSSVFVMVAEVFQIAVFLVLVPTEWIDF